MEKISNHSNFLFTYQLGSNITLGIDMRLETGANFLRGKHSLPYPGFSVTEWSK